VCIFSLFLPDLETALGQNGRLAAAATLAAT
jgi:hypothetical protein